MKARTIVIIRVVGIAILSFACWMGWYSQQDAIGFNGKELLAIAALIIGLYMTFGTRKSLESWVEKPNLPESAVSDDDYE